MISNIRLKDGYYQYASLFFILVLAVAVPTSRLLMSISEIALLVLCLWNGGWKSKWKAFVNRPVAIVLIMMFLWHIVGGFYSEDMAYLMKDLRTKLPMLLLPFLFAIMPRLQLKQFLIIVAFFIGSVLYASVFVGIEHYFTQASVVDIMGNRFVSHIRFGLNLNMAIFYLAFAYIIQKPKHIAWHLLYAAVFLWLLFAVFFLKAFTTLTILGCLLLATLFAYIVYQKKWYLKLISSMILLILLIGAVVYLYRFVEQNTTQQIVDISKLDTHTAYGNPYTHKKDEMVENGQYVWLYVAESEMAEAWNERSAYAYNGKDKLQQDLRYTLIRYLSSKQLRKDRQGVLQLSEKDVQNIENGVANVHYAEGIGVKARLYKILFEYEHYKRTSNPSGHSVMQRIEFWKTAWHIIKQHPLIGVGTGDVNIAFVKAYEERHTKLKAEYRHRSHNQYLSIWVALGVVGLFIWLFTLAYPLYVQRQWQNPFYMVFFIILILSMLTEDTLESQAGLTFYAFFNSFLLLLAPSFKGFKKIVS